MRGLRLLWGAVVASFLLVVLFVALRDANAASQVQPERQRSAVAAAAEWLVVAHQNEDGGYTGFSTGAGQAPSDVGGTADAILALASAGYNVAAPYPGREQSPIDFLQNSPEAVAAYAAEGGGANGKLILALTAAAVDPRNFAGHDLTISLTRHLSPTGQYNTVSPYEQGLAILAQSTVSDAVPVQATEWLLATQAPDGELNGSWDDGFGTMGNVDATGMAVMALIAAGEPVSGTALTTARAFLMENQLESGGWGYAPGLPESANSTALAVQALSALGEDFYSPDGEWAVDGTSPLAALLAWQGESGAFQADFGEGAADDFFTTVQALPASTGRPYPLPSRLEAARRAVSCLETMQDPQSGGWEEFAGTGPNAGGTARAIRALALYGADITSEEWSTDVGSPLDALEALAPTYLEEGRGGRVGVVMRGVTAAEADVVDFGGLNLPISMTRYLSPTGEYDNTGFGPFSHAEAMLGLLAADQDVDPAAVEWLLSAQSDDGGWGSPDATGISLQVLALLDNEEATGSIEEALDNLHATQQADGGWGFAFPSSVNSTAEVMQGVSATGENPYDPSWSVVTSGTLRNGADLAMAQQGANGCWPNLFGEGDDPFATTDGIILLSQEPPWGSAAGMDEALQPDPTAEVTATATAEVVVQATEVLPSPTAAQSTPTPEATPEPTQEPAPIGTTAPDTSPTAALREAPESGDPGSVFFWIVIALVLLLIVLAVFHYMGGVTKS